MDRKKATTLDIVKKLVEEASLAKEWKKLCRALGFKTSKLNQLAEKYKSDNLEELFVEILESWVSKAGKQATLTALIQALREEDFNNTADGILDDFSPHAILVTNNGDDTEKYQTPIKNRIWHSKRTIDGFKGRELILRDLETSFSDADVFKLTAITGDASKGKSELAKRFSYEFYKKYTSSSVVFIDCENFVPNLEAFLKKYNFPTFIDLCEVLGNERLLIVFDGVNSPETEAKVSSTIDFTELSPDAKQPSIIVTSRDKNALEKRRTFHIEIDRWNLEVSIEPNPPELKDKLWMSEPESPTDGSIGFIGFLGPNISDASSVDSSFELPTPPPLPYMGSTFPNEYSPASQNKKMDRPGKLTLDGSNIKETRVKFDSDTTSGSTPSTGGCPYPTMPSFPMPSPDTSAEHTPQSPDAKPSIDATDLPQSLGSKSTCAKTKPSLPFQLTRLLSDIDSKLGLSKKLSDLSPDEDKLDVPNPPIFNCAVPDPCPTFEGRENELNQLEVVFTGSPKFVVLKGRWGVGKSEIVKAFAKRHISKCSFVWADASNLQNVEAFLKSQNTNGGKRLVIIVDGINDQVGLTWLKNPDTFQSKLPPQSAVVLTSSCPNIDIEDAYCIPVGKINLVGKSMGKFFLYYSNCHFLPWLKNCSSTLKETQVCSKISYITELLSSKYKDGAIDILLRLFHLILFFVETGVALNQAHVISLLAYWQPEESVRLVLKTVMSSGLLEESTKKSALLIGTKYYLNIPCEEVKTVVRKYLSFSGLSLISELGIGKEMLSELMESLVSWRKTWSIFTEDGQHTKLFPHISCFLEYVLECDDLVEKFASNIPELIDESTCPNDVTEGAFSKFRTQFGPSDFNTLAIARKLARKVELSRQVEMYAWLYTEDKNIDEVGFYALSDGAWYANCLQRSGRLDEACGVAVEMANNCEAKLGINKKDTLRKKYEAGMALEMCGRKAEALGLLYSILNVCVEELGKKSSVTQDVQKAILRLS